MCVGSDSDSDSLNMPYLRQLLRDEKKKYHRHADAPTVWKGEKRDYQKLKIPELDCESSKSKKKKKN